MSENIFEIAASEWARAHAHVFHDPLEFGNKVALVYLACLITKHNDVDQKATATAAALAALSIPSEVLQLLAQLSSHFPRSTAPLPQAHSGSAE